MNTSVVDLAQTMIGWEFPLLNWSFESDEARSLMRLTVIRQFLRAFLTAPPADRAQARRLLRERAPGTFWYLWQYNAPIADQDHPQTLAEYRADAISYKQRFYLDWLRLTLLQHAIGYGMIDYRDDILAAKAFADEAFAKGVNYPALAAEIAALNAADTGLPEPLAPTPQQAAEIERLTAAIEADFTEAPPIADLYLQRALAYLQINEFRLALDDLQYALYIDSSNGEIYFQLGELYARLGNINSAFSTYTNFLTKYPAHPRADQMRRHLDEWRPLRSDTVDPYR